MINEFLPYQESLELKELGFDEPCFAYYDEEAGETVPYEYANCSGNVTGDKACYNDDFLSVTNSQLDENGAFCEKDEEGTESFSRWTAPLYQQAFRWFREKYGLGHMINGIGHESFIMNIGGILHIFNAFEFKTYEEAELACLRKLISIVKQRP